MVGNVPKEANGWVANADVREYNRKTLFKYIDGGAELYLAFRFRKAYVYTYAKADEPDVIMEVYDMSTPEDAFGVFTSERVGEEIGIGHGSEYEAGLLRFFKGRFFVSIMARDETPESRKTVLALGRAVADSIQSIGEKPELLSRLPSKGLIESSIRYFYDHNILNLNYYVAEENILQLTPRTQAVLARYSTQEEKAYLLLVGYPSTRYAEKASRSFQATYMPDAIQGIVRTENGKWTATDLCSRFVAVVFDAPSDEWARSLLEAVCRELEVIQ